MGGRGAAAGAGRGGAWKAGHGDGWSRWKETQEDGRSEGDEQKNQFVVSVVGVGRAASV